MAENLFIYFSSHFGKIGINLTIWKFLASVCFVDKPYFSLQANVGGRAFFFFFFSRERGLFIDMKIFNYSRNQDIKCNCKKHLAVCRVPARPKGFTHSIQCAHVTVEAIIEMFVCAGDGVTGWQNGGPSLDW